MMLSKLLGDIAETSQQVRPPTTTKAKPCVLIGKERRSDSNKEVAAALLVRGELFGGRGPKAEGRGSGSISEPAQGPFLAAAAHLQTCFLKFPNGL